MKKTIIGIALIGALLFSYQAQGSMGLWKYTGDLSPVVDTWDVSLGGDLEMKDDKKLYFDTAKSKYLEYSTDHGEVLMNGVNLVTPSSLWLYSNTGADGSGTWEPFIELQQGIITLQNTNEGLAGSRYVRIETTDGLRLKTTASFESVIKADNIATSSKTFQFPNASGTFITSGNLTDITTVGTIAAGTWNGTSIADANVDNNITVTGYMQDEDINTFTELQSWVSDETLLKAGTLTDTKYCIYDSASTDIICNSTPAGTGDLLADGTIPMTADFNLDGNNLDNGGVIFLKEQADADADIAGQGQIWVNTATPNELWFTDDAGTDIQLGIDTTYTAGRSLTLDGTTVNADAELYTGKHKIAFETPTATDDFFFGEVATAQTFTSIYCKTLVGTVDLDISIAGTDINGTDITCTTAGVLDSSLGGDTAGAVGEEVKLLITSVASDPTYLMVQLNYTYND